MNAGDLTRNGSEVAREVAIAPGFPKCGAKLRKGSGKCRKGAGWGTPHLGFGACRLHSGNVRAQLIHGAKLEAEAMARRVMGSPISIEPEDALQFCINVTRGEIDYCSRRIGELEDVDAAVRDTSQRVHDELDKSGQIHSLRERTEQSTAQLNVWVAARAACVDRLARYSKSALDAGVAERQVQLDERQTELIAGAMLAVVHQLASLSDDDRARLPALLAEHVGRLQPAIEERGMTVLVNRGRHVPVWF